MFAKRALELLSPTPNLVKLSFEGVQPMTNIQLLFSIGVPSFMVLLALLISNSRADRLEKSFEKRFDLIDTRLTKLDDKIESLRDSTRRDALEIMRNMTSLHERVAVVETRQK